MIDRNAYSIGLVAMILIAAGGIGTTGFLYISENQRYVALKEQYEILLSNYTDLLDDYDMLLGEYNDLNSSFFILTADYQSLSDQYDSLLNDYQELQSKYVAVCNFIKNQIIPLQVCNWAEAVRRTFLQSYLDSASDSKSTYIQFAKFCRDLVLHASGQYDAFYDVSEAFSPAFKYGTNTLSLADAAMETMAHDRNDVWDNFPFRWGWHFTGIEPECYGIDKIVQDCIDNLDYEYDEDITFRQNDATWDYPKHPVETAFRGMGDCEDQAMMCAAYLEQDYFVSGVENIYYQTALCFIHDDDHRDYGELYHAALLVHIEDTDAFWDDYPSCYLWNLGSNDPYSGYTWCFVDPTWNTPFGSHPGWLDDYNDNGISSDEITFAICDVGGAVW